MSLFTPNSSDWNMEDQVEEEPCIDLDRIQKILSRNNFAHLFVEGLNAAKVAQHDGLWILPSFINHSCLPCVSILLCGKTMYVHAARDTGDGEELTLCYIEPLLPWSVYRKGQCNDGYGILCRCKRCTLESNLERFFQVVDRQFRDLMARYEDVLARKEALARLAVDVEMQVRGLLHLKDEERQWLHAAYFPAYREYVNRQHRQQDDGDEKGLLRETMKMPTAEALMEAIHLCAPGHMKTTWAITHLSQKSQSLVKGQEIMLREYTAALGRQQDIGVVKCMFQRLMEMGIQAFFPK